MRTALRHRVARIKHKEPTHSCGVAKNSRRMYVAARHLGMRRQYRLGAL
jgi:hypothetical protein